MLRQFLPLDSIQPVSRARDYTGEVVRACSELTAITELVTVTGTTTSSTAIAHQDLTLYSTDSRTTLSCSGVSSDNPVRSVKRELAREIYERTTLGSTGANG